LLHKHLSIMINPNMTKTARQLIFLFSDTILFTFSTAVAQP